VLDRVLQGEHTALGLSLVTNVRVLLVHADHDTRVLWAAHDGREHRARGIITGETGFAHACTRDSRKIRNDECVVREGTGSG